MNRPTFPSQGLYAITSEGYPHLVSLINATHSVIRGGAQVIQYRRKLVTDPLSEAQALFNICRAAAIPFIINDNVALAVMIGADGVHLGKDDADLGWARERLGPNAIIGLSCYNSVERALEAQAQGADYVAFGRFFPSATKPNAPCADVTTLVEAKNRLEIPIVAIGGITPANGPGLIAAGADVLAVVDGVFGQENPERAAAAFRVLWSG
ncbi:MAG: thiamine phosphate synthase [Methylococcaceae bacterium]|jgi:thiamine-phosphate pyrophosphorylase